MKTLKEFKPDIVHVHNFFPLISPSVFHACKKYNVPVVQTLHNYRLLCPAGTFLRDSEVCELCMDDNMLNAIKFGCYRGSRTQTVPLVAMVKFNEYIKTWKEHIDQFICLSEFAKNKFINGGFDERKISIKPNFVNDEIPELNFQREKILLYVGRLSKEKGVKYLLEAWASLKDKQGYKIVIIGDGPESSELERTYSDLDVVFLGKKNSSEVMEYINKSKFLVVPSIWFEGFPMTIVEAFSVGTPVISSNIGTMTEIIKDNINGKKFEVKNTVSIANVLNEMMSLEKNNYNEMVSSTLKIYNRYYSKEKNYENLISIYNSVLLKQKL